MMKALLDDFFSGNGGVGDSVAYLRVAHADCVYPSDTREFLLPINGKHWTTYARDESPTDDGASDKLDGHG